MRARASPPLHPRAYLPLRPACGAVSGCPVLQPPPHPAPAPRLPVVSDPATSQRTRFPGLPAKVTARCSGWRECRAAGRECRGGDAGAVPCARSPGPPAPPRAAPRPRQRRRARHHSSVSAAAAAQAHGPWSAAGAPHGRCVGSAGRPAGRGVHTSCLLPRAACLPPPPPASAMQVGPGPGRAGPGPGRAWPDRAGGGCGRAGRAHAAAAAGFRPAVPAPPHGAAPRRPRRPSTPGDAPAHPAVCQGGGASHTCTDEPPRLRPACAHPGGPGGPEPGGPGSRPDGIRGQRPETDPGAETPSPFPSPSARSVLTRTGLSRGGGGLLNGGGVLGGGACRRNGRAGPGGAGGRRVAGCVRRRRGRRPPA